MSVGCFSPECSEIVRGQCAGYHQQGCGKYYCSMHSGEGLCADCYQEKVFDDTIEMYDRLARDVKRQDFHGDTPIPLYTKKHIVGLAFALLILFGLMVGSLTDSILSDISFSMTDRSAYDTLETIVVGIAILLWISTSVGLSIIYVKQHNKIAQRSMPEKSRFKILCETHPGFEQFYPEWKKEKRRQNFRKALNLTVGTIAAAHTYNEQRKTQVIKDAAYRAAKRNK